MRTALAIQAVAAVTVISPIARSDDGLRIQPGRIFDLGEFPAESNRVATFTLSNTSSNALRIANLASCCAFLEPVLYETTLAPGGHTPLDVIVDARALSGPFEKSVTFSTDAPASPPRTIWIKGTARPAISTSATHVFAGRIEPGQGWSTNLSVTVRSDVSGRLIATARSNIGMEALLHPAGLSFFVPAQLKPMRWQGTVLLELDGNPQRPPVVLHLEGYVGGSLFPVPGKLNLAGDGPTQAGVTLYRKNPPTAPAAPAQLHCSEPTIRIGEKPGADGESTVTLEFPACFMRRLKAEKRIPVELRAEGFIPAVLILEHAAR
ncbi:DUF1573 domain-containing protein [Pontiella sp.]|uniref:DUF1573 domain-containing protein n=1 Tax=Pontiella sp. TaxID=2837462 RepID=UPI0035650222